MMSTAAVGARPMHTAPPMNRQSATSSALLRPSLSLRAPPHEEPITAAMMAALTMSPCSVLSLCHTAGRQAGLKAAATGRLCDRTPGRPAAAGHRACLAGLWTWLSRSSRMYGSAPDMTPVSRPNCGAGT